MKLIRRNMRVRVVLTAALMAGLFLFPVPGIAQEANEIQDIIEEKRKEVEKINQEIQKTQARIEVLDGQQQTLQNAIGQIDASIEQAELGIEYSKTTIEKLTYEISSLNMTVADVRAEANRKSEAVGEVLRNLQTRDGDIDLLSTMLSQDTLADSVFEFNALRNIQKDLADEVGELVKLQNKLTSTIVVSSSKKDELKIESQTLEQKKIVLDDQKGQKNDLLSVTEQQESLYQQHLTKLDREQQDLMSEIADIEKALGDRFDASNLPSRQPGFLSWPVVNSAGLRTGVLTQHYGETAYSTAYYRGRPHNATDIGAPAGTPVIAARDGVVARVDYNGLYYQYGRYILIDHGNGLTTIYAHLSASKVSAGQGVKRGEVIGYVGNTGFSTGAHLHFGLYATPPGGWMLSSNREQGGLFSIPPATGLVPIGPTINPENYM
ncbi:MAG: hypothetical protein COT88_01640 [Candidatus Colwellbacteria bacterium CG10_big_fil_rev_8_21_14_0_10_41_28]|uniref:M23ase beta-sheet core domain-containing protein n=1 Tax=Candidatus Colwellbacteria bacterium CG10_big_fil_rev_8_21_14_0_10_41_28 TaxID=1974539 RepID=A0A2H0VHE4_9BACT|nr:MAG: hypothetical protein COT88_01640 [Candidatus Colwellbacteria bacterium CG10_big_fil_rev_8_21_14_0_10_41_28]